MTDDRHAFAALTMNEEYVNQLVPINLMSTIRIVRRVQKGRDAMPCHASVLLFKQERDRNTYALLMGAMCPSAVHPS